MNASTSAIGVVTYDYAPAIGGLGILAETYVKELKHQNPSLRITVISPSSSSNERGSSFGNFRWKKAGGCPLFSLSLLFALPRFIQKYALDVVHVHAGSGGVFLLRRPSCRLVVTSHHTYSQEARLVFRRSPLKRLWKMFMSLLERRTYKLADLVTCVSADTCNELVERYHISPDKIIVIENPVATELLNQHKNSARNPHTILFVGRLEKRKGILLLLEAFCDLLVMYPDKKLRLVGQNMMGSQLHKYIAQCQLQNHVTLLGYVEDPYRYREMAEATVLVVPSLLEGFGLVAAEAMMLGTCVLCSDAPGLRSVVQDRKTGYHFHSGDARDLLRVLHDVCAHAEERRAVEAEAMISAEQRFNVERQTAEILKALENRTN